MTFMKPYKFATHQPVGSGYRQLLPNEILTCTDEKWDDRSYSWAPTTCKGLTVYSAGLYSSHANPGSTITCDLLTQYRRKITTLPKQKKVS